MATRAGKPKVPLLALYLKGIQSHSPFEKYAIFLTLVPYVILDDVAEEGWKMIREGLTLALPVANDVIANELPGAGPGVSLRTWYDMCLSKCQELRQRNTAEAGDLCLTCVYIAITARRLATRPRAAVPV